MSPENQPAASPPATTGRTRARIETPERLLERVLDPVVCTMGYELVHLEWSGSGKHRKLAVFLDTNGLDKNGLDKKGGISLDDCSRMSPILSSALDAAEEAEPALGRLLGSAYRLEVSSPGLDRPLARLGHFGSQLGKRARITTLVAIGEDAKQKNFHGYIHAVEPDPLEPSNDRAGTVTLRADGGGEHSISLALIRRANLVFEG